MSIIANIDMVIEHVMPSEIPSAVIYSTDSVSLVNTAHVDAVILCSEQLEE